MKSVQEIQESLNKLEKSGLYSQSQLQFIKYAFYRPDFNEALLLDPTIPSEYMEMYIELKTLGKIDIAYYISEKWHMRGFSPRQLYLLIMAHSKNIDITNITPNMSEEEIKKALIGQQKEAEINEYRQKSSIPQEEIEKIKSIGFSIKVERFLLRVVELSEIDALLDERLKTCNLEQMKYLYTAYSVGSPIQKIMNPNLSVEEMKRIILSENESVEFFQSIADKHNKGR